MRTGNSDHESWEVTPYKPDPPAIDETAREEARAMKFAARLTEAVLWALTFGAVAGAVWAILRVKHL